MTTSAFDNLLKVSFFSNFNIEERLELLPFIQEESYRAKEIICREGHPTDRAFFILEGEILEEKVLNIDLEISGAEHPQDKYVIRSYRPGQHFALQSLFSATPIYGSIVANSDCQLMTISRTAFENIQNKRSELAWKVMKGICQALVEFCQDTDKVTGTEVKNAMLIKQMQIERKKIKAMHRIANSTALGSVKKTLERILDACMDCLAVEKGSIMIHDKGYLRVEAAFGPDQDKIRGKTTKIAYNSVSGRCFMSQEPIFIGDIEDVQGLRPAGDIKKYSNNSVLSLPLVSLQGVSIGVLNVSKTSSDIFTKKDLNILTDLTKEASSALGHEIYLSRIFKEFQEAFVGIRRGREQMEAIEKQIYECIRISYDKSENDI